MRVFVSHADGYAGRAQVWEGLGQGHEVVGSVRQENSDLCASVAVDARGDALALAVSCDVVVLNLAGDVDGSLAMVEGLRTAHMAGISSVGLIIGISNLRTWGGTPFRVIDEKDFHRRTPLRGCEDLKCLEDAIIACNGTASPLSIDASEQEKERALAEGKLSSCIIATTTLFGDGEDALASLFQTCWENAHAPAEQAQIIGHAIHETVAGALGSNRFMTLHVKDHARFLFHVIERFEGELHTSLMQHYFIATAPLDLQGPAEHGLTAVTRAVFQAFGGDLEPNALATLCGDRLFDFADQATCFHLNLSIDFTDNYFAQLAEDLSDFDWNVAAPRGLAHHAEAAARAFCVARELQPVCFAVLGSEFTDAAAVRNALVDELGAARVTPLAALEYFLETVVAAPNTPEEEAALAALAQETRRPKSSNKKKASDAATPPWTFQTLALQTLPVLRKWLDKALVTAHAALKPPQDRHLTAAGREAAEEWARRATEVAGPFVISRLMGYQANHLPRARNQGFCLENPPFFTDEEHAEDAVRAFLLASGTLGEAEAEDGSGLQHAQHKGWEDHFHNEERDKCEFGNHSPAHSATQSMAEEGKRFCLAERLEHLHAANLLLVYVDGEDRVFDGRAKVLEGQGKVHGKSKVTAETVVRQGVAEYRGRMRSAVNLVEMEIVDARSGSEASDDAEGGVQESVPGGQIEPRMQSVCTPPGCFETLTSVAGREFGFAVTTETVLARATDIAGPMVAEGKASKADAKAAEATALEAAKEADGLAWGEVVQEARDFVVDHIGRGNRWTFKLGPSMFAKAEPEAMSAGLSEKAMSDAGTDAASEALTSSASRGQDTPSTGFSVKQTLAGMSEAEAKELAARAAKFSGYLKHMILPHVTEGMLEMVRSNPEDPIVFLENFLRKAADRVEKQAEAAARLQFESALVQAQAEQGELQRAELSDAESDYHDEDYDYERNLQALL